MALNPDFQAALASIIRPIYATDLPDNLEAMRHWLSGLGLATPTYPFIAVAGSVGKGSTALALARHFAGIGQRIGLYTSPHLHSFRERFQIDGVMISQKAFAHHAGRIMALTRNSGAQPSTFETATLIAYNWFSAEGVDLAICEIGMGGRFDAVNAAPNQLAIFTPIEREHVVALGGTLESIAWHKAGILQNGGVGISLPQSPVVEAVFEREAKSKNAKLIWAQDEAALIEHARSIISPKMRIEISPHVHQWADQLPGRLEVVSFEERIYIIDGAHTSRGAARLRAHLDTYNQQPILLAAALLRDKPAPEILSLFDDPLFTIFLTSLSGHRRANPEDIMREWHPSHAKVEIVENIAEAFSRAAHSHQRLIAICGSLRAAALAREILGLVSDSALIESKFTRSLFESDSYLREIR
ncbi:MAG: hypothetical protein IAE89_00675 [Anaerolineae bacterium]|nr:hypothetical protein [Anaerolineae bacterium]